MGQKPSSFSSESSMDEVFECFGTGTIGSQNLLALKEKYSSFVGSSLSKEKAKIFMQNVRRAVYYEGSSYTGEFNESFSERTLFDWVECYPSKSIPFLELFERVAVPLINIGKLDLTMSSQEKVIEWKEDTTRGKDKSFSNFLEMEGEKKEKAKKLLKLDNLVPQKCPIGMLTRDCILLILGNLQIKYVVRTAVTCKFLYRASKSILEKLKGPSFQVVRLSSLPYKLENLLANPTAVLLDEHTIMTVGNSLSLFDLRTLTSKVLMSKLMITHRERCYFEAGGHYWIYHLEEDSDSETTMVFSKMVKKDNEWTVVSIPTAIPWKSENRYSSPFILLGEYAFLCFSSSRFLYFNWKLEKAWLNESETEGSFTLHHEDSLCSAGKEFLFKLIPYKLKVVEYRISNGKEEAGEMRRFQLFGEDSLVLHEKPIIAANDSVSEKQVASARFAKVGQNVIGLYDNNNTGFVTSMFLYDPVRRVMTSKECSGFLPTRETGGPMFEVDKNLIMRLMVSGNSYNVQTVSFLHVDVGFWSQTKLEKSLFISSSRLLGTEDVVTKENTGQLNYIAVNGNIPSVAKHLKPGKFEHFEGKTVRVQEHILRDWDMTKLF